jgi:hypothetical protein
MKFVMKRLLVLDLFVACFIFSARGLNHRFDTPRWFESALVVLFAAMAMGIAFIAKEAAKEANEQAGPPVPPRTVGRGWPIFSLRSDQGLILLMVFGFVFGLVTVQLPPDFLWPALGATLVGLTMNFLFTATLIVAVVRLKRLLNSRET